ncbi:hypothetical protein BJX66DRAFT_297737 [Aspergillus keveii]|uniref:Uncharacterized protein n=1 Tax=Aspergillus keveii TaxID=714993 RepID=A0ABR4GEA7_9EURO
MAYDSITDVISFSNRYIPDHFREPSRGNQTPLSPSTSGEASAQTDADESRGRTQDTTPYTATDERSPSSNTQCDPERYVVEDSHDDGRVGPEKIELLREKAHKDPMFKHQLIELGHYLEESRPGTLDDTDEIGGIKREARHDWMFRRRLLELIHLLDFHDIQRRKGEWVVHYPQGDRRVSAPSSIDVPPSSRPAQPPTLDPRLVARGVIPPPTPDKVEPPFEPSSEAKQFQAKESLEKDSQQPRSGVTGSSTGQASDKGSSSDGGVQLGTGPGQTHPAPQRGGGGDVRKRKQDTLPTAGKSSIVPKEPRPRPVSLSDDPFSERRSAPITEPMDMAGEWMPVPQPSEYTSFPGPAPSEASNLSTSSVGDEAKASVSTSMRPHVSRPESPRARETAEQSVKTELPSGFSAGGLITVPDAPTHPVWGTCPGPIGSSQGNESAGGDGMPSVSDSSQRSSSENRPDGVRRYSRPINVPSPEPEATGATHYAPPRTAPPPQWDNPPPNDRSPSPPPPELVTGRRLPRKSSGR